VYCGEMSMRVLSLRLKRPGGLAGSLYRLGLV
jgi:hypothetical protein